MMSVARALLQKSPIASPATMSKARAFMEPLPSEWTARDSISSADERTDPSAVSAQAAHLRPERKIEVCGYDLDAVAVEYDDDEGKFDFRFELGQGLGIYWALP